uniref:Uncharacterized protein n=1 Tax=Sphaerodactylus townsendi TaxID=933632 RepID=A0ACB8FSS2_9SAUR
MIVGFFLLLEICQRLSPKTEIVAQLATRKTSKLEILQQRRDIDPWHALSVLKNQSRSELALLINGTAHCANMMPSRPTDPLPLVQARKRISAQVGEWLELAQKITGGR